MYKLKIVTPTQQVVSGEDVEEVFVPAHRGELNILPGHAPMVTTLQPGLLKYRLAGSSELVSTVITWGYCEVHPDGVTILAETAEAPAEINRTDAQAALQAAQEKLLGTLSEDEFDKYERQVQRARVRVEAATK